MDGGGSGCSVQTCHFAYNHRKLVTFSPVRNPVDLNTCAHLLPSLYCTRECNTTLMSCYHGLRSNREWQPAVRNNPYGQKVPSRLQSFHKGDRKTWIYYYSIGWLSCGIPDEVLLEVPDLSDSATIPDDDQPTTPHWLTAITLLFGFSRKQPLTIGASQPGVGFSEGLFGAKPHRKSILMAFRSVTLVSRT